MSYISEPLKNCTLQVIATTQLISIILQFLPSIKNKNTDLVNLSRCNRAICFVCIPHIPHLFENVMNYSPSMQTLIRKLDLGRMNDNMYEDFFLKKLKLFPHLRELSLRNCNFLVSFSIDLKLPSN